ncbi:MAG: SDR family oxidoreductase [Nitrospinota bacterium]|nr:MAG: SDR family oxidoreductase [Nitrospinota bacterium]
MTQRYLVTGGAGFIGSHIAEALLRQGQEVIVIDNLATGKKSHLEVLMRVAATPAVQEKGGSLCFVQGDLRDFSGLQEVVRGVDFILHQAALPSVARSLEDPQTTSQVNIEGTLNLLVAAYEARVKRFVYASSSSVYGDSPVLPKHEDMPPQPLSPYAVSKLAGEQYCRVFAHVYGLETVSLRYFNVFGPRQNPYAQYAAVIPRFIHQILNGERPVVYGDGEQSRDFSYIDNIVQANLLALEAPEVSGMVCNIACGERITLNELLQELGKIFGQRIQAEYTTPRPGDVKHSQADISRARQLLRYRPIVGFAEGLRRTVAYIRQMEKERPER